MYSNEDYISYWVDFIGLRWFSIEIALNESRTKLAWVMPNVWRFFWKKISMFAIRQKPFQREWASSHNSLCPVGTHLWPYWSGKRKAHRPAVIQQWVTYAGTCRVKARDGKTDNRNTASQRGVFPLRIVYDSRREKNRNLREKSGGSWKESSGSKRLDARKNWQTTEPCGAAA